MKFLIAFLLISTASAASTPFVKQNSNVVNEPLEMQEAETIEPSEPCQYFLQISLENDNFGANGNDKGYTHGHLTRITKSCNSGRDISISLVSRLFTETTGFYILEDGEVIEVQFFEEENRIHIEDINWRDFRKIYQRRGLTIGTFSRDELLLSGLEQKMFHKAFGNVKLKKQRPTNPSKNQQNSSAKPLNIVDIPNYKYLNEKGHNREFVGGNIAFGKSYSLDGLREICDEHCIDYFRTEAGIEISSLKHSSNVYISSEIDKSLPHPLEAFSVFASIKAQKNDDINGIYNESAFGLRFRADKFQLHYILKKRSLPEEWNKLIEYDNDEDEMVFFGIQIEIPFE